MACVAYIFRHRNLDVLLHGTNAAGLSAFNPCERRMAPLSHDLAGIVLPHDIYRIHLHGSGKSIDEDLERRNFFQASEALADVWKSTVIDNKPVFARAAELGKSFNPEEPCPMWLAAHVRRSRYCLQIVKCVNSLYSSIYAAGLSARIGLTSFLNAFFHIRGS